MKIGKKSYLLIIMALVLLLGSIPFLGSTNSIKASSEDYKLEIVRVQEYNKLVIAKLSVAKLSGQKLQLKAEGTTYVPVEGLFEELALEDSERLSTNGTDRRDLIDIEFVDDGKAFTAFITMDIDRNSTLEEGNIQLLTESGKVVAETTFEINNQGELKKAAGNSPAAALKQERNAAEIAAFDLAIPTPGVTADVTNWADFKSAMESPTIDWINIKGDLTASSTISNVGVSKVINGNDNGTIRKIDMGSEKVTLVAAAAGSQLILTDVDLVGTSDEPMLSASTPANSANWTVATNNVNVLSGNQRPLAHLDEGNITLAGTSDFQSTGFVLTTFLRAKNLLVEENADITANLTTKFFEAVTDNASMNVTNGKLVVSVDAENAAVSFTGKASLKFTGSKTNVIFSANLTTLATTTGSNPNAIHANTAAALAISDLIGGSEILLDDQAQVVIESRAVSKGTPALLILGINSKIEVSNDSKLTISGESADSNSNAALIRYGNSTANVGGGNSIKASNDSEVIIDKKGGASPGIRMYGDANEINIESGSDFILHNVGDGQAKDPGANARNQGIQYRNGAAGNTSSFSVTGDHSNVSIITTSGAAIDCNAQMLDVTAGEGSYFIVRGKTESQARGVFSASGNKLTFNMDKPKYFDFRNDRSGGGYIFEGSGDSEFNMIQSDLQVWKSGINLDGNPSDSWSLINSKWSDVNFSTGITTNGVEFGNFEGAPAYSRMTANNQKAIIDELRVPTDADKYIWGHATVPEGKYDPIRAAYTGEVGVRVSVSEAGSVAASTAAGTIVEDPSGTGAVSVYGDDARAGIFKIPTSNGDFLVKGQRIEVVTAWRGALADEGGSNVHISDSGDIQTPQRTVLDVTPPQPTRLTDENLNNAANILSGTGAEAGATVYIYYDTGDRASGTLLGTTTVLPDGSWSYQLTDYLIDTKELSVYLGDNVIQHAAAQVVSGAGETPILYDQTGLIKPPATNQSGGNINPYTNYSYHDAVFEGVKKYIVADVLPNLPIMTKTVVADSGSTTDADIGEELTYTLIAKNDKPTSVATTWKGVVVTDVLPRGLTFTPATAEVAINGTLISHAAGTPNVNEYSYDAGTRLLTVNIGDLNSAASATITFKAVVAGTASGSINNTATALGESPRFADGPESVTGEYEKISETDNALLTVAGTLSIASVPDIDFKIEEAKLNEGTRVIDPKITGNLVVADNRVSQKSWTLTAKLLAPMKAVGETDSRYILEDAVRYDTGTEEKVITIDGTNILTHTHDSAGEYNVNSRWSTTGEGFKFYIDGGKVNKLGKYEAILEFTLEDTPIPPTP
ncbi:isopeptide-forming domain-containing fimbrial protein [Enterococcus sp. BWM-S5]|uniref:Isopeptide-forming domain-containing fimbrial protein n=1 Tax=Enterococcus larvae TaxID=2794352 RepID=A0ABS4CIW8_9ENTE|nr:pectate lyase-like adhesive domain-containing protein [Enterococcus larvae]MBP1046506.1 isopeptide-forming domain-containing fimbrial protein [Enterococcus larvae]